MQMKLVNKWIKGAFVNTFTKGGVKGVPLHADFGSGKRDSLQKFGFTDFAKRNPMFEVLFWMKKLKNESRQKYNYLRF